MNVNDLKKSKFLTKNDVMPPVLVTIESVEEVNVAKEGADPEMRWTLIFKEMEKPLVLNSTNGQIIAALVGSEESDDWIGHKIVLYNEPTVSFGGKITGGIRVRAPKTIKPKPMPPLNDAQRALGIAKPEPLRHQEEPDAPEPDETATTVEGDDIPF